MLLFANAGAEIKRVHVAAAAAVAELQRPQLVNNDAVAGLILQRTQERAGCRVVSVDRRITFAEITDEQSISENAERGRRDDHAPGRVESPVVNGERKIADAVRIELADEAVSYAFLIFAVHPDFCIRDVK